MGTTVGGDVSEVTWGGCRSYSPSSHIPDVCTFPPGRRAICRQQQQRRRGHRISSSDLPTCPAAQRTWLHSSSDGGHGRQELRSRPGSHSSFSPIVPLSPMECKEVWRPCLAHSRLVMKRGGAGRGRAGRQRKAAVCER